MWNFKIWNFEFIINIAKYTSVNGCESRRWEHWRAESPSFSEDLTPKQNPPANSDVFIE